MKYVIDSNKPDVREKALCRGIETLFDNELIALILGTGTKEFPIQVMADKIAETMDDTNSCELVKALQKLKGVGKGKSLAIVAALELGKRRSKHLKAPINSPKDIIPFVRNYSVNPREHFLVITLNGGHEIIQIHVTSVGTLNKSLVHPREVFSEAIKENAAAIILCHNHPSGNCNPSQDDIDTTFVLVQAAKIIGIPILDHIIIDCESYYSFLENDVLFADGTSV